MKKKLFCLSLATFAVMTSCSSDSSSSDLPSNAKYIKTVHVVNTAEEEDQTVTVNYNTDGSVANVTDGTDTNGFVYNDNHQLTTITGSDDPLSMSELYQSPYDGYEFGEVLQYDNNGNPTQLRLFERDYDGNITQEYRGFITYDPQANPFLHTLEKAGILDVIDNVDINFASVPGTEQIVTASQLMFQNNPKTFTVKDLDNNVIDTVVANYVYDAEGYPTSGTFTDTDDSGSVSVTTATYTYLP
ncbi:MAG: hypothetical protein EOO48_07530 [Flavobacterium sp.]|nr:MAG: hypothetical protein EOO48_07530 [Flavobacterium sp.]